MVLDAVSCQISILRTNTCLRLTDGTFYGFEGCSDTCGCCEGSCTHVWNYAQALPYLFPALQRSVREADWANSMQDDGFVCFRMPLPLGTKGGTGFHPAADGQMGTVIQVYREWLICGDDEWLRKIWPQCAKALEFAWKYWDADNDGVMEGMQHNTYDIEFYGPEHDDGQPVPGGADGGGEAGRASRRGRAARRSTGDSASGRGLVGREAVQRRVLRADRQPEGPRGVAGQPAADCAINHGRTTSSPTGRAGSSARAASPTSSSASGMPRCWGWASSTTPSHVRKTLQSIFKYNWKPDLTDHFCSLRVYALNDEAGLLIGTWPKGERPGYAFWFADEVWCGIEYQVASHLIYEGFVEEGLAIVKGVRDRHTGERRNPWDEFECGHHYARSLASYAVLLALSGFSYSAPEQRLGFAPRVNADDFRAFFSVGSGWGSTARRCPARRRGSQSRWPRGA